MKKQRKPSRGRGKVAVAGPAQARAAPAETSSAKATLSRRHLLRQFRNGTIAVGVLALGGWGLAHGYQTHVERHDLSVIGNGIPTVVQIHDPQCPNCRALQKEMMSAAKAFDEDALQVRVANIRGPEGRALADRHGVAHVTLLLFDGQGELQQVLRGVHEDDYLRDQFRAHLARSTTGS